ncbi:MAG TPA: EF-hand domain-containing protein [Gemmataceae bacterium]|jgi:Ca2+-binding EF-hand superfamily protein|nr:EF-hand domain-containing protein [Gemmataceae bacterium]
MRQFSAWQARLFPLAAVLLLHSEGTVLPCQAAGPPPKPQDSRATASRPSGPPVMAKLLGGIFHVGESRYGWYWLATRFDADRDGTITRKEFPGTAEQFDRLDRNGDGVLTADDFEWELEDSSLRPSVGPWFSLIDANSNGRISRKEWQDFFSKNSKGKGYLTPEDLEDALRQAAPRPRPDKASDDGPSPFTIAKGFLSSELGSLREGPAVGQPGPEFNLKTADGKRRVRLSQYRGKKPVVLVFGSFT